MKISVIGLGYVGAVTAVCLARDCHDIFGADLDPTKVSLLQQGKSPIIEEGIAELTEQAVRSDRLRVCSSIASENVDVDVIFVCVGTPSRSNGSQDLTAIKRVASEVGALLKDCEARPAIVIRSTIPPGSTESLIGPILEEVSGKRAHTDFGLGFQPEFLREGTSVKDFYNPPFTVVGGDEIVISKTRQLFGQLPSEFVETDAASAEMLKFACNAFHATKVTFANEIGRLSQALGIDGRGVMDLLCQDKQLNISAAYLRPGFAFGGSCLPKDLRALVHLAKTQDVELPLLTGTLGSNTTHINHAAQMIYEQHNRKIGFIGLSFKQGTDDLRESPLVGLAELLVGKGYELQIYDEAVNVAMLQGSNKRYIDRVLPHFERLVTSSLDSVLDHAEVLVIGHSDPDIEEKIRRRSDSIKRVIDLSGIDPSGIGDVTYRGICW